MKRLTDTMIIAFTLFVVGILCGWHFSLIGVIAASIIVTAAALAMWIAIDALSAFSALVWVGYLFALQSGYLVGAYIGPADDR